MKRFGKVRHVVEDWQVLRIHILCFRHDPQYFTLFVELIPVDTLDKMLVPGFSGREVIDWSM